ncbi:hypothetical protein WKV44_05595 [Spirochaetia bacterium 38H-sp]|uniref:NAD glycohydrolase translocation F5/8 type C domain-containing protein n=1 Tax=Rarispira pelagica TaxID=3141764 RepID=A0ABU9UBH1_9SPIR
MWAFVCSGCQGDRRAHRYARQLLCQSGENFSARIIKSGRAVDAYEVGNLCDGDSETTWGESVTGDGIGEYVYCFVDSDIPPYDSIKFLWYKLSIIVKNGFCISQIMG